VKQQIKVLSLLEPWATLKAIDAKRIETRSWATKYRGEVFVHSSKKISRGQRELIEREPFRTALRPNEIYVRPEMNCGHIIARTEILDVIEITPQYAQELRANNSNEWSFGDYTPGRFAWIMGQTKRLVTPVPIKGQLGIWTWQPDEYPMLIDQNLS